MVLFVIFGWFKLTGFSESVTYMASVAGLTQTFNEMLTQIENRDQALRETLPINAVYLFYELSLIDECCTWARRALRSLRRNCWPPGRWHMPWPPALRALGAGG